MNKNILNLSIDEPLWNTVLSDCQKISESVLSEVIDFVSQNEDIDFLSFNNRFVET